MTSPKTPKLTPKDPWSQRWAGLARAAGLRPTEPVAVAFSGGADSTYLLHVLARAQEKPRVLAIHVDHGLRGEASQDDAAFCARTAARLQVPFARIRVELDPQPRGLEERARKARYAALAKETRQNGIRLLLTGHHEDDALETLLQRWTRGSDLAGLPGLKQRRILAQGTCDEVTVLRPLLPLRREEVRCILKDEGIAWREDASNEDHFFTRNRIRSGLLPALDDASNGQAMDGLRAFASAVESLENELATCTAHITWTSGNDPSGITCMERTRISALPGPLQRRTLWRLIQEGCGGAPTRQLLDSIATDLEAGSIAKHTVPGGWTLELGQHELVLVPPTPHPDAEPLEANAPWPHSIPLNPNGVTLLPDGRQIKCEPVDAPGDQNHPGQGDCVELDGDSQLTSLTVRLPRAGDRFQALGAPGHRKLSRFLSDAGIIAQDRQSVPLVLAGEEIVWVAGVRPGDRYRLRPATQRRVRLTLLGIKQADDSDGAAPLPGMGAVTRVPLPSPPVPTAEA